MTDQSNNPSSHTRHGGMQTGFIFGDELDASASLTNMDPSAPVDSEQGLTMTTRLRHGYSHIDGDDPNRCSDNTADAVNVGAFIAGAGAAGSTAAVMTATPIPGARPVAAATLVGGGLLSVGKGYIDEFTGGFQFSVRVRAKKKGGGEWYQLGHALPCVPSAPLVGDAKRDAQFSVYSPPEPGEWTVEVIMETYAGEHINTDTREITVEEGASSPDQEDNPFNLNGWVLDNPAKAGMAGLTGLVVTRSVIDNTLGN